MTIIELFDQMIERIEAAGGMCPAHQFHDRTTAEHLQAVVEAAKTLYPEDEELLQACYLHDLGKVDTWNEAERNFKKHDVRSEELAREVGASELVCRVVGTHSWIYNIHEAGEKSVRKFLRKISEGSSSERAVELYTRLQECDMRGFSAEGRAQREIDLQAFREKVQNVGE